MQVKAMLNRKGGPGIMTVLFTIMIIFSMQTGIQAQAAPLVKVINDAEGSRIEVDGRDFMIFGMNWDYVPIGENYLYSLWVQPDDFIKEVLDREMPLLSGMGVNVIRQYVGIPPRWVEYIYRNYGIYTVVNHPMGRYGFTVDGIWYPSIDYSDPKMREAITADIVNMVKGFEKTPGMLFWLLGNENNYGLHWSSSEVEALPEGQRDEARARYLYTLYSDVTDAIKAVDSHRPVALANGDLQYIDILAEECRNLDILGSNVYRGISARDFFSVVRQKLGIPVMFTEFGADAWDEKNMREDQLTQARFLLGQWEEIYEQSYGKGREGNAIGGFIFQWSDGWWKFGQESRLDFHDTNASWPDDAYPDFVKGQNNMNEEWWGITAKGFPDNRGLFEIYPRAAYYALQKAFKLDPFAPGTDIKTIREHFEALAPMTFVLEARSDHDAMVVEQTEKVRVSNVRMEFETYSTGGSYISTPKAESPQQSYPSYLGFDHMQSFYTEFEVKPAQNFTGTLSLNILGHVAVNPIDEIFYENRGRRQVVRLENGKALNLDDIERVKVYGASVTWDEPWFRLDGYYRTGHTHWGYEGDFFGIYRDAYYGENIDIYNAEAPVGLEMTLKQKLEGLKIAFGPQMYWGANPAVIIKYSRQVGRATVTGLYQEEFARQSEVSTSSVIPLEPTRRATLAAKSNWGRLGFELGGIWAGSTKKGEAFQIAEKVGDSYLIYLDHISASDALGGKGKVTFEAGRWHWYAQAAFQGLVADGGPTAVQNFTGWKLVDSGWYDNRSITTGLAVNFGNFQIGPNFLWQKPIEGPIPGDAPAPGVPRNVVDDPFAVRYQREMVAGELILTHDPTPATWMWAWDNDIREDAKLAWSLGYVFRHMPTTMDASIGFLEDGVTDFAFPGATPPRDLWEVWGRTASKLSASSRLVTHFLAGTAEPRGDDSRLVKRFSVDARITMDKWSFATFVKVNDFGPYDYHHDFNMTFPLHLMGDLSYAIGKPTWFGFPQTRIGVRGLWRSLDEYSNRYCPERLPGIGGTLECDPTAPGPNGTEWEIRTYMLISL
jgi:hypothetical protein